MRLLHVSTFRLESFIDEECPPYAILSHTWGKEETTLQEVQLAETVSSLSSAKRCLAVGVLPGNLPYEEGVWKIAGCAFRAETDGFEYIWCDTCCIDKTNSTELSEAINSMYEWYSGQLCYAYLEDGPSQDRWDSTVKDLLFSKSRWFTRGWTLQELIAPSSVVFFNATWHPIGTRLDYRDVISKTTNIDIDVLDGQDPLRCSIANRMSWASRRQTTRIEDLAYCLMGLFGVNMPLIYGEKRRAFLRLQTEIMKISEDHSLFAWKLPRRVAMGEIPRSGLLASQPACFSGFRNFAPFSPHDGDDSIPPFSMTSRGVNINLSMAKADSRQFGLSDRSEVFFAVFNCQDTTDTRVPYWVFLIRESRGSFRRYHQNRNYSAGELELIVRKATQNTIYVAQNDCVAQNEDTRTQWAFTFYIAELDEELSGLSLLLEVYPNPQRQSTLSWDPKERRLDYSKLVPGLAAAVYVGDENGRGKMLLIGLDSKWHPRHVFHEVPGTNIVFLEGSVMDPKSPKIGQYWTTWNITFSSGRSSSETILDLGYWSTIRGESPESNKRKWSQAWTKDEWMIGSVNKKRWLDCQWVYEVSFEAVELCI
ncbi:MAG: hypothetical protein Q9178_007159 [Gyalolechia marmorata]